MKNVTPAELETLKEAWKIWDRIKDDLVEFSNTREGAKGGWRLFTRDFLYEIDDKGITMAQVNARDDGDWDADYFIVVTEELLDLENLHAKNVIMGDFVKEERQRAMEETQKETRKKTYEQLKKEFDDA